MALNTRVPPTDIPATAAGLSPSDPPGVEAEVIALKVGLVEVPSVGWMRISQSVSWARRRFGECGVGKCILPSILDPGSVVALDASGGAVVVGGGRDDVGGG